MRPKHANSRAQSPPSRPLAEPAPGAFPRLASGREERFLQLFLENERRIYAYILALVPALADADDLLQETAIVLWRKMDEFTPGTSFLAWSTSIARFEVLSHHRGRHRARIGDRTIDMVAEQLVEEATFQDDRGEVLKGCLEKLGEGDREMIRLRYQEGATTQGVAERLGRSPKAVYKRLNRLHGLLLKCVRMSLAKGDDT